jgi:hypothetical protein
MKFTHCPNPIFLASLFAFSSCSLSSSDYPASQCGVVERAPSSSQKEKQACLKAKMNADRRLFEIAIQSAADPGMEAKKSADQGDFRLIGYSMFVPGIFPAAYGVACRPAIAKQRNWSDRVRALYAASDVPPVSDQELANLMSQAKRHRAFGEKYNAALLADPRFPHRNTCRPVTRELEDEGSR